MFPLTIEFSRTLNRKINENEFRKVLELISQVVTDKKGKVVYIGQQELTYKGSDSVGRHHIFTSINKGIFKIQSGEKLTIEYTIYLATVVSIGVIAGIVIGICSQDYLVGIFTFLWAGGINWTIAVIRHGSMLNDIMVKIDDIKLDLN